MLNPRHALVAVLTTVALLPAGHAHASVGGTEAVRTVATDAADLLVAELSLLEQVSSGETVFPADLNIARAQLRAADGEGQSLLVQLQALDVSLSPAIETALDRLPAPGFADAESVPLVPQPMVYLAAIDDLLRIAETPAAFTPGGQESGGPSSALLIVAAVALLVLGIAARTNTLWRNRDEDDLEALAWSDGLTGLANRRRLDHDLKTVSANGPTSVIMIDVDHFKTVNDSYGHQTGDDILKRLGTLFEHHVRVDDVVYRYGGEEFCVLLPGADATEARLVADRIVEAAHGVDLPDGANITVSIGIAGGAGDELFDAVEYADKALYIAKQQGRDRAVHADEHGLVGSP